jgi:hypothetical protein
MALGIEAAKNTWVISQLNRPFRGDQPRSQEARSSYVEVMSFKFILFSAFWANGGG